MNKDYIAGLIEGEGSFYLAHYSNRYEPKFYICFRDDDVAVLEEMHKTIGFATKIGHRKAREMGYAQVELQILSLSDTLRLIDFLGNNPFVGKKREQYEIWKQAVYYREKTRYATIHDAEKRQQRNTQMKEYYDLLRNIKKYKGGRR